MDSMMSTVNLELATMDELIEEIMRRNRSMVLVYEAETRGDAGKSTHNVSFSGGMMAASGLVAYIQKVFDLKLKLMAEANLPKDL